MNDDLNELQNIARGFGIALVLSVIMWVIIGLIVWAVLKVTS